jgi:glutamate-1-semialdehyde 2,1-aminomutase
LAGGVPAAVYGFTTDVASRIKQKLPFHESDTGGIGGTLTGNALAVRSMRATLEHVLTEDAYKRMLHLGDVMVSDIQKVIDEYNIPFIVKQLGCRVEYWPSKIAPRNGGEAADASHSNLDAYFHLYALNRGVLITPFHNMLLLCPDSSLADVSLHTRVFRDCVRSLLGLPPLADCVPPLSQSAKL